MKDNGGLAFPLDGVAGSINRGMTLRQWYKGMLSIGTTPTQYVGDEQTRRSYREWAARLGRRADALIAEDREAEK